MARDIPARSPRNGFVVDYVNGRERTVTFRRSKEIMALADAAWDAEMEFARRGEIGYGEASRNAIRAYEACLAKYDRIYHFNGANIEH